MSFCSDFHCSRITNKKLILFANNERTNEQLTDFVFTPKLYILYYNSNLLHIFPILYPFLCDKFTIMLYFIELIWLKKYVFKKWVDFSEKIQQYETKIGEFEKQLFVLILFPNNEQLFSMTNNKYSGTNKKHRYCIWYLLERGESPIYF